MPAKSVNCVVTSPPYFRKRDYGVAGQIGIEYTPAEFLASLVEVFREVRRVLRDDGTAWLNMGDGYANDGKFGGATGGKHQAYLHGGESRVGREKVRTGLKPKDLMGMPWELAFALRADGWWLRSDIIWYKQNPMPENVDDRPTTTHEYVFLLTKSQSYYYDFEAIQEPVSPNTNARLSQDVAAQIGSARANAGGKTNGNMKAVGRGPKTQDAGSGNKNNESFAAAVSLPVTHRNKRSVWTTATEAFDGEFCTSCRSYFQGDSLRALRTEVIEHDGGKIRLRYCRCGSHEDWLSHFATFPPALIEPCIKARMPRRRNGSRSLRRRRHNRPGRRSPAAQRHPDRIESLLRRDGPQANPERRRHAL